MMPEGPWVPDGDGPRVRVILLTLHGFVRHAWEGILEQEDDQNLIVRALSRKELVFPDVTIQRGDRLVVYFPKKEWFYIQKYLSADLKVKGWYCNIGTPIAFENSTIQTQDLILDIFVKPEGEYKIIDEDEFEAERQSLNDQTVQRILEAKDKLIAMIKARQSPFNLDPS